MDWLWFCEFDIDDDIPNHSILSKARRRWGGDVFKELFVRILYQCVNAGLVEGHKIHIDSTLIVADASLVYSFIKTFTDKGKWATMYQNGRGSHVTQDPKIRASFDSGAAAPA